MTMIGIDYELGEYIPKFLVLETKETHTALHGPLGQWVCKGQLVQPLAALVASMKANRNPRNNDALENHCSWPQRLHLHHGQENVLLHTFAIVLHQRFSRSTYRRSDVLNNVSSYFLCVCRYQ